MTLGPQLQMSAKSNAENATNWKARTKARSENKRVNLNRCHRPAPTGRSSGEARKDDRHLAELIKVQRRKPVMPLSETQDAVGPIARTVADAARLLQAMVGYDPNDPSTAWSIGNVPESYLSSLYSEGLKGACIGILKVMFGNEPVHQEVNAVVRGAIAAMQRNGATIVEIDAPDLDADKLVASNDVQKYEFKNLINIYLAGIPNAPVNSLAEIIASGKYHKPSIERLMVDSESYQDGMLSWITKSAFCVINGHVRSSLR
jgi:hypothetical protein